MGSMHPRSYAVRNAFLWLALLVYAPLSSALAPGDFLARNTRPDGSGTPFRIFVPKQQNTGAHLPLLIFLNGSGQVGNDNAAQLTENTDDLFDDLLSPKNLDTQPILFAVPQSRWMKWDPAEIAEVVASVHAEFDSDADRVYLTGLSTGGDAVWDTLKAFPNLFAAGVPLCAATSQNGLRRIARISVWVFHGTQDHEVDPSRGDGAKHIGPRRIVAKLRAYGGRPVYTEYRDLGHMVWDRAYAEPQLFRWLLAQKRLPQATNP